MNGFIHMTILQVREYYYIHSSNKHVLSTRHCSRLDVDMMLNKLDWISALMEFLFEFTETDKNQ